MYLSYTSTTHYFNPGTDWSKHCSCWQPDPSNWYCLDRNESGGTRTRRSACGIRCGTLSCQAAVCWEELCGVSCPCRWRKEVGIHFYFVFPWSVSLCLITVVLWTPTPSTHSPWLIISEYLGCVYQVFWVSGQGWGLVWSSSLPAWGQWREKLPMLAMCRELRDSWSVVLSVCVWTRAGASFRSRNEPPASN